MGRKRGASEVNPLLRWIGRLSMKVKIMVIIIIAISSLVALNFFFAPQYFFIASETSHALGIMVLIYKLTKKKSCSGLSLKSQELTAIFLGARLYCSMDMEGNIHTVLDLFTLVATAWVIYMIRFKLKSTCIDELDNMPLYYTVVPCAVLAVLIHPGSEHAHINNVLWAFCIYLESVSVLPQLHAMQNAKMVEPFTAHYVFALGVARFFGFATWIIERYMLMGPCMIVLGPTTFSLYKVFRSRGRYLFVVTSGYFWIPMAFLAELVQTFILADFCYYYAKNVVYNQRLVSLSIHV